ncbi:conserved hypothetical protein [Ricinus communis]|uniref:DUF4283 domain-containing protein n=1 Tax=Ricinus communis TaxID=3988 RepID=B9STE0_RICCO|nr:conserved hypothetical protein [Ricinus communis]
MEVDTVVKKTPIEKDDTEGNISVTMEPTRPSILLSDRLRNELSKPWENSVVVKLLEKKSYTMLNNRIKSLWKIKDCYKFSLPRRRIWLGLGWKKIKGHNGDAKEGNKSKGSRSKFDALSLEQIEEERVPIEGSQQAMHMENPKNYGNMNNKRERCS